MFRINTTDTHYRVYQRLARMVSNERVSGGNGEARGKGKDRQTRLRRMVPKRRRAALRALLHTRRVGSNGRRRKGDDRRLREPHRARPHRQEEGIPRGRVVGGNHHEAVRQVLRRRRVAPSEGHRLQLRFGDIAKVDTYRIAYKAYLREQCAQPIGFFRTAPYAGRRAGSLTAPTRRTSCGSPIGWKATSTGRNRLTVNRFEDEGRQRHEKSDPLFQAKLDEAADWLMREFAHWNAIQGELLAKGTRTTSTMKRSRPREAALRGRRRAVPAGGCGLSRLAMARDAVGGRRREHGFNAYVVEFAPIALVGARTRDPVLLRHAQRAVLVRHAVCRASDIDVTSRTFEVNAVQDAIDSLLRLAPPADE